jgi:hypothetical protein
MAYEPKLPDGVSLPPGLRVDTSDARYRALEALATRESWSQAAFSETLGIEARRVSAEHERTHAAPGARAPAPAAKPDFSKLSSREQIAHALANSPGRKAQS